MVWEKNYVVLKRMLQKNNFSEMGGQRRSEETIINVVVVKLMIPPRGV